MRARRFVPLIAAAFLLVPALPASAHIEGFDISHLEPGAFDGVWDQVHGFIDCAEGESFLVTAKVIDDGFKGKGRVTGTCAGFPQGWVVNLTDQSDVGDGCYERASAKAHTKINGVGHDEARDTLPPNCAP